jgi:hypothetical protein
VLPECLLGVRLGLTGGARAYKNTHAAPVTTEKKKSGKQTRILMHCPFTLQANYRTWSLTITLICGFQRILTNVFFLKNCLFFLFSSLFVFSLLGNIGF